MANVELENYREYAKHLNAGLDEWCNSQSKTDLYINSGKVETLQLKVWFAHNFDDVVFGLREDGHTNKAAKLESAIADAKKAVEDYDNGNISGTQLIEKVLPITGELTALCRPLMPQKSPGTEGATSDRKNSKLDFLYKLYEKTLKAFFSAVIEAMKS